MTSPRTSTRLLFGLLGAVSLVAVACGDDDDKSSDTTAAETTDAAATTAPTDTEVTETTAAPETTEMAVMYEGELVGMFTITAGDCSSGTPVGSWFQMVNKGGTAEAGPFVPNADSTCSDMNYSVLTPGSDGGLMTGDTQAAPDPAFDATGNGLADPIFMPVKFFGVAFAGAMDPAGEVPAITATDGVLSGDLSAFTAYYGGGTFNQGAPKPDGSGDGPTGTIDPETGAFVLEWTSLIVGGSFDGFIGVWHLEGTFAPMS